MTAIATARMTKFAGLHPALGTLPMAANTLIFRKTMVGVDASGNAVNPDAATCVRVLGVSQASFDNRTGSEAGGLAGDLDVEFDYGLFEMECADTDLVRGEVVYGVDNQTVSKDSLGGARPVAATYHETGADGKKYFYFTTGLPTEISGAAEGRIDYPLGALRLAAGTTIAAFAAGSADGIEISEGVHVRWNADVFTTFWADFDLPSNLDDNQDIVVRMLASRVGSADAAAVITVGAFLLSAGDAVAADSDAGGASSAVSAATTILQEVTYTITSANVPVGARKLSLSLVPSAALDDDDMRLHGLSITFGLKG
jgi:hypothetical protein